MTKDASLAVIDGQALTKKDIMERVDDVVVELRQTNSMSKITKAFNAFDEIDKVSGLAKAKLLWNWELWYKETGQAEKRNDEFVDMVESETGFTKTPTKRYMRVWEHIENNNIPKEIQSRRMDDLIKIATVLSHGFEISKEQWKELERAATQSDVAETLRKVTGKEQKKSGIQIVLYRNGTLNAHNKDGTHYVGFLEVHSEDEVVKKVIQRIIDNTGVQEK
jgi:hypothetical protein